MHLHTYMYTRARIGPNTVADKKKKQNPNAQCKKKALRTTETNPLHCITIIKSFAELQVFCMYYKKLCIISNHIINLSYIGRRK